MAGVAPAGAATVSYMGLQTTFTDTADEVNTLSVAEDLAGQIVLTDTTTPPVDGDGVDSGCSVAGDVATCPVSSSPFPGWPGGVIIATGGGADTVLLLDTLVTYTTVDGGPGTDELTGGANDDRLLGGFDEDTLIGNGGDDILTGGMGGAAPFEDSAADEPAAEPARTCSSAATATTRSTAATATTP